MVIDKAINHSFRSRELYWPLQALRVVLINVKPDVNVTARKRRATVIIPFYAPETRARACIVTTWWVNAITENLFRPSNSVTQ